MDKDAGAFRYVLADTYHIPADTTSRGMTRFEDLLGRHRWVRILGNGYGRGLALFLLGRYARLFLVNDGPAARILIMLEALTKRRRVVLLDVIRPVPRGFRRVLFYLVDRPTTRRAVRQVQVFSRFEVDEYAALYRLPRERIRHVNFPMMRSAQDDPPSFVPSSTRRVFASGRAACDWPTLFEAARGADWDLVVVCGRHDAPLVDRLNQGSARVYCEIPYDAHDRLQSDAAVVALCLREQDASSGHVRFAGAIEHGIPVVVAATRSMADYAIDGENAITYPVGDAAALRRAVNGLLDAPELRMALAKRAYEWARNYTVDDFVDSRRREIRRALLESDPDLAR